MPKARKPRVLFFLHSFPALSETFVLDQITGLIDEGCDVRIMADIRGDDALRHPAVEAYGLLEKTVFLSDVGGSLAALGTCVCGMAPWRLAFLLANTAATVDRFAAWRTAAAGAVLPWRPDVVIAHFGPNGLRAARMRSLGALTGRIVTFFHGYDVSSYVRERGGDVYQFLFSEGDLHLPISEYWRRSLGMLGCPPEKTVVHRMGIDTDDFTFRARLAPADGDPAVLLSVCRLVPKKGIGDALEAFARLDPARSPFEYRIIGDGPLRGELEAAACRLGIADRVRFLGSRSRPEVLDELGRAHLFVAPSVTAADGDQEGIPVAIMEAMSCGLPVISTRHTGIPELVADGASGYLVEEHDIGGLASVIERALLNPETWADMGRIGRGIVEEAYQVDTLNARLAMRIRLLGDKGFTLSES